jgi:spore germination cell wall hydrolase CwlJ-like protein
MDQDTNALALTMIGEASNGGAGAMQDVGSTVMNRIKKKTWYGGDVCTVCYRMKDGIYQYSCWTPGTKDLARIMRITFSDPLYALATAIAESLINGSATDRTSGATHYYAKTIACPAWARGLTPCYESDDQLFFNNVP